MIIFSKNKDIVLRGINKKKILTPPIPLPRINLMHFVLFFKRYFTPKSNRKSKKILIKMTKSKYIFMISPPSL